MMLTMSWFPFSDRSPELREGRCSDHSLLESREYFLWKWGKWVGGPGHYPPWACTFCNVLDHYRCQVTFENAIWISLRKALNQFHLGIWPSNLHLASRVAWLHLPRSLVHPVSLPEPHPLNRSTQTYASDIAGAGPGWPIAAGGGLSRG